MCPPHRRAVLSSAGGLAALLAGCNGIDYGDTLSGTQTTGPDLALAVSDISYRTGFFYPAHPDAPGVAASSTRQFVFCVVETAADPPLEAFELVVDGFGYPAARRPGGVSIDRFRAGGWPEEWPAAPYEDGSGLVAFSLPRTLGPVDSVVLVVDADGDREEWVFPEERVDALGRPPAFEASLSLPAEVVASEPFDAEVTVDNGGGRTGRFVATFGIEDAEHPDAVTVDVEPGETVTEVLESRYPPRFEDDVESPPTEATFVLDRDLAVDTERTTVIES